MSVEPLSALKPHWLSERLSSATVGTRLLSRTLCQRWRVGRFTNNWSRQNFQVADQKIGKFDMEHQTTKLPDFWWDAVNTCCFAILNMSYGFNHSLNNRRFVKHLFEWKLRNVMDGSVLHIAVSTLETLEVRRPASKEGRIVRDDVLSIRTTPGSVNLMSGLIHCH